MSVDELAARVPAVPGLLVEHIVPGHELTGATTPAVLVDQWGRRHPLRTLTVIGRGPEGAGLAILEGSVSRRHAELRLEAGAWRVRDLGSRNGTFVDGQRLTEPRTLADRQLLTFGSVGLVLVTDARGFGARALAPAPASTVEVAVAQVGSPLRLIQPAAGEGGVVELGAASVQLGATQYALVALLAERYLRDQGSDPAVRGFVRAVELLTALPWDTPHPNDNNVKQLVRRVRRALARLGLEEAIESRQGFGYRLVLPRARP